MLDPTASHEVAWADVVARYCKELRVSNGPPGSIFDMNQMEFIPADHKDKLAHLAMERNEQAHNPKSKSTRPLGLTLIPFQVFERAQKKKQQEMGMDFEAESWVAKSIDNARLAYSKSLVLLAIHT